MVKKHAASTCMLAFLLCLVMVGACIVGCTPTSSPIATGDDQHRDTSQTEEKSSLPAEDTTLLPADNSSAEQGDTLPQEQYSLKEFRIIYPYDTSAKIVTAVFDLKSAIKEKTGYSIKTSNDSDFNKEQPYEILIGDVDRTAMKEFSKTLSSEQYAIKTLDTADGLKLLLTGDSDASVLAAIDAFTTLMDESCVFTEENTFLSLNILDTPPELIFRKQLIVFADELTVKWVDRMHALGVDTLAIHSPGGVEAGKALQNMLDQQFTDEFKACVDYAISLGMNIEYEVHAASYLLPRELFQTHPEYFRMNESGIRTDYLNFCVSNADALAYVANRAVELADSLYRSSSNYYFWMDDAKNSHCYCPECSKLSPSDQQLLVMNAIVEKLRENDPNAKLAYLAYYSSITPPTQVKPSDGIFLEYAPIERDMKKPVAQMPNKDIQNIRNLLSYFGTKDAKVLEYWFDNSFFSHWTKPPKKFSPNNELIVGDIQFYLDLGFENISSFACYLGPDYENLYGEPDVSAFKD